MHFVMNFLTCECKKYEGCKKFAEMSGITNTDALKILAAVNAGSNWQSYSMQLDIFGIV
jgi:hypothetical protein